jgi:cation:H+ antiporter
MPDWILSLAVLILGLIGLILGSATVHRAVGHSVHLLDLGDWRRFTPWLALVAILPVMAVTLQAVWSGASALGLGAIIGVHVLGVLLAIRHIATRHAPDCLNVPFSPTPNVHRPRSRAWSLIGAAVGVWGLALDGVLGPIDGAVLVLLCLLYLIWMAWTARQPDSLGDAIETQTPVIDGENQARPARSRWRLWGQVARVCMGLTLLTMGARVLTMGMLDMALVLDLDHWMLGLTLVALAGVLAGWLPILIAKRRPRSSSWIEPSLWFDLNLVNLLGLVGLTALTTPGGLPFTRETLLVSWPLVILTSILAGAALIRAEPA